MNQKFKKAFSMIELVFAIVVMGIVASIGSTILVQVYENYITQRAVYNSSTKTEMVANQLVNLLTYRINGTTIGKDITATNNAGTWTPTNGTWEKLDRAVAGNPFRTLEWIGYDSDSFSAMDTQAWSGVANYETATMNLFETPASHLANASTIMKNITNGKVDLTTAKPAGLIFDQKDNFYDDNLEYTPECMGLIKETNRTCIFPVARADDTHFSFSVTNQPKIITERYKLSSSAYAIVPEVQADDGLSDLYLYSNYQPWNGKKYNPDGQKSLLLTNVSVFRFSENGGVLQFKLCQQENIGKDFNITTCKEKAVIR